MVYSLPCGKPFYSQHDNSYTISDNNIVTVKKKTSQTIRNVVCGFRFSEKNKKTAATRKYLHTIIRQTCGTHAASYDDDDDDDYDDDNNNNVMYYNVLLITSLL